MGPNKEELKLKSAQCHVERTSDLGVLQKALLDIPGAFEFCTHDPHHEGAKVFSLQKRKPDTSIGTNNKTHRHDTMNFLYPCPAKRVTRARTIILSTIPEERCRIVNTYNI